MGIFSNAVYRMLKYRTDSSILNATELTPEIRKEIRRIFSIANKRIARLKTTKDFSPAYAALSNAGVENYKFSMKKFTEGMFTDLKEEYAKAVAFLKQPTSTLSGTKQYNDFIKAKYNLTAEEYYKMLDSLQEKYNTLSKAETNFVELYLKRYKDFTGDLENQVSDVSDQMESDAIKIQNELEAKLEMLSMSTEDIDEKVRSILEGFAMFDLW